MKKIFIGFFKVFFVISAFISVMPLANYMINKGRVDLTDLGYNDYRSAINKTCDRSAPKFYDHELIREQVAQDNFIYSLASLSVYDDPAEGSDIHNFRLENYADSQYQRYSMTFDPVLPTDLGVGVYVNDKQGSLVKVIVAFRGTRLTSFVDWLSNASWFAGVIPIANQYTSARLAMKEIRQTLSSDSNFKGRDFSFVATGHSLGGGLAQHVAYGFPCVSAVVFDSSPVINAFYFKHPFSATRVVNIHEDRDELTWASRIAGFSRDDTDTYRWYPENTIPCEQMKGFSGGECEKLQHRMIGLSVGMARLVADCQTNPAQRDGCRKNINADPIIRDFYCFSYFGAQGTDRADTGVCSDSWKRKSDAGLVQ